MTHNEYDYAELLTVEYDVDYLVERMCKAITFHLKCADKESLLIAKWMLEELKGWINSDAIYDRVLQMEDALRTLIWGKGY